MGYTHYWNLSKLNDESVKIFKEKVKPILADILKRHASIICYEYDEVDKPPVLTDEGIRFNGTGEAGHETFAINIHNRDDFDFCKTAHKPYDVPACECLLVLSAKIPEFTFSSDGLNLNSETKKDEYADYTAWGTALENVKENYDLEFDSMERTDEN